MRRLGEAVSQVGKAGVGVLAGAMMALSLAGCAGDNTADAPGASADGINEAAKKIEPDQRYGTVHALMEAAVEAGYECKRWRQTDKVTLAAESGNCSSNDVFSTYASDGDLQSQLETERAVEDMFADAGIEPDPTLVGPNWIIKSPKIGALQPVLGGTVNN